MIKSFLIPGRARQTQEYGCGGPAEVDVTVAAQDKDITYTYTTKHDLDHEVRCARVSHAALYHFNDDPHLLSPRSNWYSNNLARYLHYLPNRRNYL